MKKFKIMVATFLMVFAVGSVSLTVATPAVNAAADSGCNTRPFLTFPAWYRGLTDPSKSTCEIKSPNEVGGLANFIWRIVLNSVEILLQVVAYAATVMIIVGGFRFLTSAGNPSGVEAGKKTLTNAVIGLVISISSIAIVNLIFGIITGFKA